MRLLRNRRSAQAHRDRKKIYVANLEKRVKELEEENTELKMLVDNLREENERLRSSSPLEDGDLFREIATFGEEEEDEKDYIHAEEQTYSSDSDHQVSPPQSPGPTSFVAFAFVFCFLLFGGSMVNDLVVRSPSSSSARLLTSSSHHHLLHNRALMSVVSSSSTPTPSDNDDDDVFQVQDLIQDHEEDIINNNDNKEQDKDAKLKWALERYISKYVELVRISKQMNENKAIALWKPDQDKEMQAVKDILRSNGIPLVFGGEGTTTQDNVPLISFSSEETLPSTSVVLCPRAHGFIQEPKTKRLRSSFFIEGQNLTLVVPGEDLHFGSWGKTRDSNALYEIGCKMQSVRPVSSAKISME